MLLFNKHESHMTALILVSLVKEIKLCFLIPLTVQGASKRVNLTLLA